MHELQLQPHRTALVVIDLQKGIAARPARPYPADTVIRNASLLAAAFRNHAMPVFLVHVAGSPEIALKADSDEPFVRPSPLPDGWSDFVPEIGRQSSDIVITKNQWGAFYGTDLELQLRRRGLDTIVLCGIATDYGVESTARFAYEYGFRQVFAEDAMTSSTEEQHRVAVRFIFPRMGRVRTTRQILDALG